MVKYVREKTAGNIPLWDISNSHSYAVGSEKYGDEVTYFALCNLAFEVWNIGLLETLEAIILNYNFCIWSAAETISILN